MSRGGTNKGCGFPGLKSETWGTQIRGRVRFWAYGRGFERGWGGAPLYGTPNLQKNHEFGPKGWVV